MTPLQSIRKGIETGDWDLVVSGYAAMTGETLDVQAREVVSTKQFAIIKDDVESAILRLSGTLRILKSVEPRIEVSDGDELEEDDDSIGFADNNDDDENEEDEYDEEEEDANEVEEVEEPEGVEAEPPPALPAHREQATSDDKFRVVHKGPSSERLGRTLPLKKGEHKNLFKDNGKAFAKDKKIDQALTANVTPTQRRAPVKLVSVKCSRCSRKLKVEPVFAPKKLDKDDQRSAFICDRCIGAKS